MVDFGSQIDGFVTTIVALALAQKPHSPLPPTHSAPPPSSQSHARPPPTLIGPQSTGSGPNTRPASLASRVRIPIRAEDKVRGPPSPASSSRR
uniref:Uncharacterized protein n=1 Tax=Fagus sylvatica TaxID=28930 RepID=A0A2N9HDM3_FAGSY